MNFPPAPSPPPRRPPTKSGPSLGAVIGLIVFVGWLLVAGASCWLTDVNGDPVFLPWLHNLMEPLGFC